MNELLADVQVLRPRVDGEGVYFFQKWFCEAWEAAGGAVLEERIKLPWRVKQIIGRLRLCFSIGSHRKKLLITASGRMDSVAWPWCYFYELVPVLWDVWPFQIPHLIRFVRRNRVRLLFCTSSQVVDKINCQVKDCHAVWMPEGIKCEEYPAGMPLKDRSVDILEYGRRKKDVHESLLSHDFGSAIKHVYPTASRLVEPNAEAFRALLRDAKIVVCYPQCDTNPQRAGEIETLTQRYWECMLSGALIVGRAPEELIRLCGYNPVVSLSASPADDIGSMLTHINDFQALVDRNRTTALKLGDLSCRVQDMSKTFGNYSGRRR